MMIQPLELWQAVRNDSAHVIQQCRQRARQHSSAAVRVRLAQLSEYAELLAAEPDDRPIKFAGRLDHRDAA